ncbi:MAG: sodium-translocating pyrophosphatase [Thaumarchaeota archaeon]|nr:sodium-translocating pyrophosphatase [Candidatus Calditenuaceae archaeon]MDW8042491.1 sodium-translocating pyrophosphatase [Nitrososphaerota archaeon]
MWIDPMILTTALGALGALTAVAFVILVNRYPKGPDAFVSVWAAIREGSSAYLKRQYKTIYVIAAFIFLLIVVSFGAFPAMGGFSYGLSIGGSFILGVTFSLIAASIAMDSATRANVRTAYAASKDSVSSLRVATLGGAALGLAVIAMSLLGLSILYWVFRDPGILAGFGFGASLAALFAQLGGGIYTKSADIGADLVGKVEVGIPEDDPRNPAVIADQVGDNVGDEAGRGADLFESVTAENLGGMIIALMVSIILFQRINEDYVVMPLLVRAVGVVATLAGVGWAVYQRGFKDAIEPLRNGLIVTSVTAAVLMYLISSTVFGQSFLPLYVSMLVGLVAGILIMFYSEIYTSLRSKYVGSIASNSESGPALTVVSGLAVGMISTALPVITVVVAIVVSYLLGIEWAKMAGLPDLFLGGVFGTTMATMGMLSTAGFVLTMDGVGPIVDNAGGIAEMANAPKETRDRLEPLDALGNTTKALTKSYAMGSAALAALLLFQAFLLEVGRYLAGIIELSHLTPAQSQRLLLQIEQLSNQLQLNSPTVLIGLFIGAMIPFLFSGYAVNAVANGAFLMVEEVRRQFRTIPGLLNGAARPEYGRCVDISTRTALKLMVTPTLVVTLAPILVGVLLGWKAVGALVIGATISAIPLAIVGFYGGAAMDNAKKYLEIAGKKGSDAHKAAVVGDTVGDPMKDTYAPSLHILIKLLNTLSLVFIPLFIYSLLTL